MELPKRLYHVVMGCGGVPYTFIPRLPDAILDNEDRTTPRICLSSSVINCLIGIGHKRVEDYLDKCCGDDVDAVFTILSWNTADLDHSLVVTPEQLDEQKRVDDAYLTREYWYKGELSTADANLIEINISFLSYDDSYEYFLPYEIRQLLKKKYGDNTEEYDKAYYEEVDRMMNDGEDILQIIPITEIGYQVVGEQETLIHTPNDPTIETRLNDRLTSVLNKIQDNKQITYEELMECEEICTLFGWVNGEYQDCEKEELLRVRSLLERLAQRLDRFDGVCYRGYWYEEEFKDINIPECHNLIYSFSTSKEVAVTFSLRTDCQGDIKEMFVCEYKPKVSINVRELYLKIFTLLSKDDIDKLVNWLIRGFHCTYLGVSEAEILVLDDMYQPEVRDNIRFYTAQDFIKKYNVEYVSVPYKMFGLSEVYFRKYFFNRNLLRDMQTIYKHTGGYLTSGAVNQLVEVLTEGKYDKRGLTQSFDYYLYAVYPSELKEKQSKGEKLSKIEEDYVELMMFLLKASLEQKQNTQSKHIGFGMRQSITLDELIKRAKEFVVEKHYYEEDDLICKQQVLEF